MENLKKYSINNDVYVQITEVGWKHIKESCNNDQDYLDLFIKVRSTIIDGVTWYRFQLHELMYKLPITLGTRDLPYLSTILIEETPI